MSVAIAINLRTHTYITSYYVNANYLISYRTPADIAVIKQQNIAV